MMDEKIIAFGGTLKATRIDETTGRIGGYLIYFTGPEEKDLHGEYFDAKTDLCISVEQMNGLPFYYQHGLDETLGIKQVSVLENVRRDDVGVWAEAQIDLHDEYNRAIYGLAEKGVLGFSSGAWPQSVKTTEDGWIARWRVIEGSGTPTPAMPKRTVISAKAYTELLKDATGHEEQAAGVNADTQQHNPSTEKNQSKGMTMDEMTARLSNIEAVLNQVLQAVSEDLNTDASEGQAALAAMSALPEADKADMVQDEDPVKKGTALQKAVMTAYAAVKAKRDASAATIKTALNAAKQQMQAAPANMIGGQRLPAASGGSGGTTRVSVGESRKFAHLTDMEMALTLKVLQAAYPPHLRGRLTFKHLEDDGIISSEFVKTWQHKAARGAENFKAHDDYIGRQSESAIKGLRFLKADELNSSDITGQGLELPGVYYDNMMWERAREKTELFNLLAQRGLIIKDVPQGAETVNFKIDTSSPTVYTRHQARSVDSSGRPEVTARITPMGTDDVEVTPAEHVLATSATDILTEDSVIKIITYLNADVQRTLSEALEDAFINGDIETGNDANINLIDGQPATGLQRPLYIAFDGFRKHALVTYSGQSNNVGAALSIDTYFDTIAEFDDNAIESRTNELLFIVDKDTHRASRKLPELLTPGVAGDGATIYVGQLPDIDGVKLYRSGFLRKSNTSGKISASDGNNTKGQTLCVFPYYWGYGRKRDIAIETDRDIMAGVTVIVGSIRHALIARSAKAATISYNITV